MRKCGPFSQLPAVDLDKKALLEVWSPESLPLELFEVALKKKVTIPGPHPTPTASESPELRAGCLHCQRVPRSCAKRSNAWESESPGEHVGHRG